MNGDRLKELLNRIPVTLLMLVYAGYVGWDYYSYLHDDTSPLTLKQHEIDAAKAANGKLKSKVKDGEAFLQTLDAKVAELRRMASDLDGMKVTLTESLDVPEFLKIALTEAKRAGLTVQSLKPLAPWSKEFYAVQPFQLDFRGVYVQLMLFLDRMANVQKIVRVDNFTIKPRSSASARYVEIEGTVERNVYRYLASKADGLGRDAAAGSGAPPSSGPGGPGARPGVPAGIAPGAPGGKPKGGNS